MTPKLSKTGLNNMNCPTPLWRHSRTMASTPSKAVSYLTQLRYRNISPSPWHSDRHCFTECCGIPVKGPQCGTWCHRLPSQQCDHSEGYHIICSRKRTHCPCLQPAFNPAATRTWCSIIALWWWFCPCRVGDAVWNHTAWLFPLMPLPTESLFYSYFLSDNKYRKNITSKNWAISVLYQFITISIDLEICTMS